jgi:hypothetical protein
MPILQFSDQLAHAMLDQIETVIGVSAVVRFYSGSPPANCGAAPTGSLLATITLASDWAAAAASRRKTFSNMPLSFTGSGPGTQDLGWWGLWNNAVSVRSLQGDITATGGGGSMTVDAVSLSNGQTGSITSWSIAAGNGP